MLYAYHMCNIKVAMFSRVKSRILAPFKWFRASRENLGLPLQRRQWKVPPWSRAWCFATRYFIWNHSGIYMLLIKATYICVSNVWKRNTSPINRTIVLRVNLVAWRIVYSNPIPNYFQIVSCSTCSVISGNSRVSNQLKPRNLEPPISYCRTSGEIRIWDKHITSEY